MILGSSTLRQLALLLFLPLALQSLFAQQQAVTAADYARAERLLPGNLAPLVYGEVRPNWIGGADLFWYRKTSAGKSEFVLVDAAAGTQQPAFDHARLAAELSKLAGRTLAADHLPFQEIEFSTDMRSVTVALGARRFVCDRAGTPCSQESTVGGDARNDSRNQALSPDGKRAAFIRDWNLWVRDIATGKETQLTHDGVKDFGYATDNAGWSTAAIAPLCFGRRTRKRLPLFSRTSAMSAKCILSRPRWAIPFCTNGSIRSRATQSLP